MRRSRSRSTIRATRTTLLALALSLASPAQIAIAQSSSSIVAAEALFEKGRQLMAEEKYAEACPKFADSQKLDPKSSTLLNLANCYEKSGRTATAWATYREAAALAKKEGHDDYVATASKRADALAPKLSKLVVRVTAPVEGLEIKRDGLIVTPSEWGAAIPADPGTHVIEASAPHKEHWKGSVVVPGDAGTGNVDVPALVDAKEAPKPPPPKPPPIEKTADDSGGGWRTAGWLVGGVGIVSAGVGTFFILRGKSKFDDSQPHCSTNTTCDETGVDLRNDARTNGNLATGFYVLSGVAIVSGAAMIFLSPSREPAQPSSGASVRFVPTLGGAALMGSF